MIGHMAGFLSLCSVFLGVVMVSVGWGFMGGWLVGLVFFVVLVSIEFIASAYGLLGWVCLWCCTSLIVSLVCLLRYAWLECDSGMVMAFVLVGL